jgi:hypothetical protein
VRVPLHTPTRLTEEATTATAVHLPPQATVAVDTAVATPALRHTEHPISSSSTVLLPSNMVLLLSNTEPHHSSTEHPHSSTADLLSSSTEHLSRDTLDSTELRAQASLLSSPASTEHPREDTLPALDPVVLTSTEHLPSHTKEVPVVLEDTHLSADPVDQEHILPPAVPEDHHTPQTTDLAGPADTLQPVVPVVPVDTTQPTDRVDLAATHPPAAHQAVTRPLLVQTQDTREHRRLCSTNPLDTLHRQTTKTIKCSSVVV